MTIEEKIAFVFERCDQQLKDYINGLPANIRKNYLHIHIYPDLQAFGINVTYKFSETEEWQSYRNKDKNEQA